MLSWLCVLDLVPWDLEPVCQRSVGTIHIPLTGAESTLRPEQSTDGETRLDLENPEKGNMITPPGWNAKFADKLANPGQSLPRI